MDFRRLILLLVFSFSLTMLWEAWQKHNNPQAMQAQQAALNATTPTPSSNLQTAVTPTPSAGTTVGDTNTATLAKVVTVSTDLFKADISTQGGDVSRLELLKQRAADSKNNFLLFDPHYQYAAQSGLIGDGLANHKTAFTLASKDTELADGAQELKVRLEAAEVDGIKVAKILTFQRGSYVINTTWEIVNNGEKSLAPHAYFQLQRNDEHPAGEAKMVSTFTGPAVYTDAEKYQKIDFADIAKDKARFAKTANDGWVAMVQHYFVAAWLPAQNLAREFFMRKVSADGKTVAAGVIVPFPPVAANSKASLDMPLFAGPQEQSMLKQLAPGLDLVVDYGWLKMIAAPIFWVLQFIHAGVGNWGWAIILLTVALKALFYPLSAASYKSMAKMRTVTPRLMQIKERFADDKQRLNQEMMKLYQTEKINPLGGCFPILIQIPVFIALYWVLLGAVEMRGAPWLGWIHDLSAQDPYYILPVIMMATMFIQTKLNPAPPDPIQAKVMMAMPLIFGVMFFFFPAGLVLYWVVNNILSIAQQWQITRAIEAANKG